jgi:tRNA pseudouridine32 synthase/23S rRNA pseudouridine746 synthase
MKIQPSLPIRDGVAPSYVWLPAGPWHILIDFLITRFPAIDRSVWVERMARGDVRDDRGALLLPQSAYRSGACVFYYRELPAETVIPFDEIVLFRNDEILVVDKPHFLPVSPVGRFVKQSLLVRLKQRTGLGSLVPIHRLDRETAGVILFSVNPSSRNSWQSLFRNRLVHKVYEARAGYRDDLQLPLTHRSRLVADERFFRMREVAGEPNTETHIELIAQEGAEALYRLRPVTGKMHQLRVHMNSLGIPIRHDGFYPEALPCKADDFSSPLQLLARSLSFQDPVTGELRSFESSRKL